MIRQARFSILVAGALIVSHSARAADSELATFDFNRDIRPILSDHCFQCHGPDAAQRQAGLRLDRHDDALKTTETGARVIWPGKPDESELVRRIFAAGDEQMPPADSNKQLTPAEKDRLKNWIAAGAPWQEHWSFVAPVRPRPPAVAARDWPRGEIDCFILEKLEAKGLAPSPEADRATLIRRLSLDLTGLPPAPGEVDAFLADERPDAYERLVGRLLDSPHYGERLALEWLDAARFADTHGYHIDAGRDMTRWRQWVIDAFNRNLPFDEFTVEQLAGDLLPDATLGQKIASGFNRNHMINFEGGAVPEEYHAAYIIDRVNTTGTVWLGLTIGCTQCHDHKFDPITQREFYQLYAFFHNVPENGLDGRQGNAAPLIPAPSEAQRRQLSEFETALALIDRELAAPIASVDTSQAEWEKTALAVPAGNDAGDQAALPADVAKALAIPAGQRGEAERSLVRAYYREHHSAELRQRFEARETLGQQQAELRKQIPTVMVMQEMPAPRDTFVLVRGQYDKRGERVLPGVPACLPPLPAGAPANRLGLARWLVDPAQPLTARVIANRYWQMLFGVGLVKTAEDFGSQGERPSHAELLDWLAVDFRDSGWDVKRLLRQLVTSAAYRQASVVSPAAIAADPENRWLARAGRLRLPAELIRDQALFVSGLLDRRIGGASVSPYQPPGLWEELMSRADGKNWSAQEYVQSHGADLYRRTMYTFWKRTSPPPTLATFDAPDRETCTVRRARTNTPLQALVLMNDPTYVEAARKLAERVLGDGGDAEERMARMVRLVLARRPGSREVEVLRRSLDAQVAAYRAEPAAALRLLSVGESPRDERFDVAELAAWTTVASMILNLDESVNRG